MNRVFIFFAASILTTSVWSQEPAERIFKEWDKNGDGVLEKKEVPEGPRKIFDKKDVNGDGKITLAEHLGRKKPTPDGKGGKGRPPKGGPPTGGAAFVIRQTWEQEPDGFDRPVYVSEPQSKSGKVPVVIYFHGNGGSADRSINQWSKMFPDRLVVAPQGYLKSWNIQGEKSKAPDVKFFEEVVAELGKKYRVADMDDVSLVGSSNGAGYLYRLMIEAPAGLFQKVVPTVSSLTEAQYHRESFWKPSGSTDDYDTKATPAENREILYIHGTADKIVPYEGGLRFGKYKHHSAPDTAFIWARQQGYQGSKKTESEGKKIGEGLYLYEYENSQVSFLSVKEGTHGLAPHRDGAMECVKKFLE